MSRFAIYIILSILLLFGACGKKPGYVIAEDKMADILYDIQLAQAIYRDGNTPFSNDSVRDALVAGVLAKHKITQIELDTSLVWYSDNIKDYLVINDSVSGRLRTKSNYYTELKSAANAKMHRSSMILPPFFYLNELVPTMAFDIDSFKMKTIDKEKFHLRFDVQGLNPLQKVEAAIFFTYDDTLVKEIVTIDKNTRYVFSKPQLPDSLLKNISGYVHIRGNKVKGLPLNMTLYNISYQDSLSIETEKIDIDKLDIEERATNLTAE